MLRWLLARLRGSPSGWSIRVRDSMKANPLLWMPPKGGCYSIPIELSHEFPLMEQLEAQSKLTKADEACIQEGKEFVEICRLM